MIGKRKGKVVKGTGQPGAPGTDNIGGSLSKADHWYLQQGFGMVGGESPAHPGLPDGMTATGGRVVEYSTPPGAVYRFHVFNETGAFVVPALAPPGGSPNDVDFIDVGGGGGASGAPGCTTNVGGNGGSGLVIIRYKYQ